MLSRALNEDDDTVSLALVSLLLCSFPGVRTIFFRKSLLTHVCLDLSTRFTVASPFELSGRCRLRRLRVVHDGKCGSPECSAPNNECGRCSPITKVEVCSAIMTERDNDYFSCASGSKQFSRLFSSEQFPDCFQLSLFDQNYRSERLLDHSFRSFVTKTFSGWP